MADGDELTLDSLKGEFERLQAEHVSFRADAESRVKAAEEAVASHSVRSEALAAEVAVLTGKLDEAETRLARVPVGGWERQAPDLAAMTGAEKIRYGLSVRGG